MLWLVRINNEQRTKESKAHILFAREEYFVWKWNLIPVINFVWHICGPFLIPTRNSMLINVVLWKDNIKFFGGLILYEWQRIYYVPSLPIQFSIYVIISHMLSNKFLIWNEVVTCWGKMTMWFYFMMNSLNIFVNFLDGFHIFKLFKKTDQKENASERARGSSKKALNFEHKRTERIPKQLNHHWKQFVYKQQMTNLIKGKWFFEKHQFVFFQKRL